jgi:hypothetical protein
MDRNQVIPYDVSVTLSSDTYVRYLCKSNFLLAFEAGRSSEGRAIMFVSSLVALDSFLGHYIKFVV